MNSRLSNYPRYSWLAYPLVLRGPRPFAVHRCRHAPHRILITIDGQADVTVTSPRAESRLHLSPESIGYLAADDHEHVFAISSPGAFVGRMLCLPRLHLPMPAFGSPDHAHGLAPAATLRDEPLNSWLQRLVRTGVGCPQDADDEADPMARQIVNRLAELLSLSRPEWPGSQGVFPAAVMRHIVAAIDSSLHRSPRLRDLCALEGLSPNHFARKFQHSAGLSLIRFLNRRRIRTSLEMLLDSSWPLSQIALDLGFSSQSHFTRVFSDLTGMPPNQFRRLRPGRHR
mgnify:CR=1 FL=1